MWSKTVSAFTFYPRFAWTRQDWSWGSDITFLSNAHLLACGKRFALIEGTLCVSKNELNGWREKKSMFFRIK